MTIDNIKRKHVIPYLVLVVDNNEHLITLENIIAVYCFVILLCSNSGKIPISRKLCPTICSSTVIDNWLPNSRTITYLWLTRLGNSGATLSCGIYTEILKTFLANTVICMFCQTWLEQNQVCLITFPGVVYKVIVLLKQPYHSL